MDGWYLDPKRSGRDAYLAGHLPGAVFLDVDGLYMNLFAMNGGSVAHETGAFALLLVLFFGCFASSANAGINQWTRIGPEGVDVRVLAIDPRNPATVYAGTRGGVFKSTDGGANWQAANTGLTALGINALAIDPLDPATVYAATGVPSGVFKSTDGGASWQAANTGPTARPDIRVLAIDPRNPATVYAGNYDGGVLKSTNGGTSWQAANTGLGWRDRMGTPAYKASKRSLEYSAPADKRTKRMFEFMDALNPISSIRALAIDPLNAATVYAGTTGDVFKSTNGGASWQTANTGLRGGQVNALAIDPLNPATVYAGKLGAGVFKSTDGGASWQAANTGLTDLSISALAIDPLNPATVYVIARRKFHEDRGSAFKITFTGGE